MDEPACRFLDDHICPVHGSGRVVTYSPNVYVNSRPIARVKDRMKCFGAPDFIVTGTFFVQANKLPIATLKSKTAHQGIMKEGSPNVRIGGAMSGTTLGNPDAAEKACKELAATRPNKDGTPSASQHYGNCGVESARLLIHGATGSNITEGQLLVQGIQSGASKYVRNPTTGRMDTSKTGGTYASGQNSLLATNGVPATTSSLSTDQIAQATAEGRGVLTTNEAGKLWGASRKLGPHEINITGARYDRDGNLIGFNTVDSGKGDCNRYVDIDTFNQSHLNKPGDSPDAYGTTVTNSPVWK